MADRLNIVVPRDLRYRDAVGALVESVCQRLEEDGAESGLAHQVLSAFNEAFNNLALHGTDAADRGARRAAPGPEKVEVMVEIGCSAVVLELRDQGEPFGIEGSPPPNLDALPESGLGLFIMRSFMTSLEYLPRAEGQTNVLRMVRDLRQPLAPHVPETGRGPGDATQQRNEDA